MTMSGNDNMFQDAIKIKLFESVFNLLTQVKFIKLHELSGDDLYKYHQTK